MKKGTKANAIDDLGKLDTSKMTIKVNGKQIYPQKRYSIVRVDGVCPLYNDKYFNRESKNFCVDRFKCKDCRYGDTKEQLIAKVETAIRRLQADKNRIIVGYDMWAKFIVEFLGVEE